MNTLLASSIIGVVWLALLFVLCFICVHVLRLAKLGQQYRKAENKEKTTPTPLQEIKSPPATASEPIYYIVERKKRVESGFSEPKQIRFK